jgi:hypothetical protein
MAREAPARDREAGVACPSLRAPSRRWFAIALLLAVIVHLPALPFDPLFLARILVHTAKPAAEPPRDEELLVPVDLDLLGDAPRADGSPDPGGSASAPGSAPGPAPEPSPAAPAEGPAQEAKPAAPAAAKDSKAEDIYDGLDTPRRATAKLKDALTVAGGPGKLGVKSPNVQVLFNGSRLRGNNAGAALGGVLTALPEWKSFFEGTSIDPIGDAEHLLIAGPQLRKSRDAVVWMQYRVSEKEMRDAIDTLVKRSKGGKWIDGAPVPAAIARAHGYRRVFALVPGKKLLAVLPYAARGELEKLKSVKPFNQASKAGIVIALTTPRNAFAGYEDVIDVPKSFKWLRFVVTPLAEGGADVALEIGDTSPEDAAKNAPLLEKQLSQVRTLAKLATIIGADVLPPMKVEVDRDILRVNAQVSQKGLSHILNLARAHFAKKVEPEKKSPNDANEEEEKGGDAAASSATPAVPATSSSTAASAAPSSAPAPSTSAAPSSKPTASSAPRLHIPTEVLQKRD